MLRVELPSSDVTTTVITFCPTASELSELSTPDAVTTLFTRMTENALVAVARKRIVATELGTVAVYDERALENC